LVTDGISTGADFLRALDAAGFPVTAAFWYLNGDTWRYLIATPVVHDEGKLAAYHRVNEILRSSETGMDLLDIAVVSPGDDRVAAIRESYPTGPHEVKGIRFPGGMLNRVFIEGAYIYRAA
jgi:hypothetical protein